MHVFIMLSLCTLGFISLFPLMPENIEGDEQDTSNNDVDTPLSAHRHYLVFVVTDKIPDVGEYPYPNTGTKSREETELYKVHSAQSRRK